MATTWRFQYLGEEYGPITFRELVGMVREGELGRGDRVRASWMIDWQRAEDVVGLFRMARLSPEELENFYSPHLEADKGLSLDPEERKEWWERLEGVRAAEAAAREESPGGSVSQVGAPDSLTAGELVEVDLTGLEDAEGTAEDGNGVAAESGLAGAIAVAVDAADGVEAEPAPGWWGRVSLRGRRFFGALASVGGWVRPAYRLGFVVVSAWLTWSGLNSWNETERLRFPARDRSTTPVYSLPVLGRCSESEYSLALVNATGVAAIAGFAAANFLLSKVEP